MVMTVIVGSGVEASRKKLWSLGQSVAAGQLAYPIPPDLGGVNCLQSNKTRLYIYTEIDCDELRVINVHTQLYISFLSAMFLLGWCDVISGAACN